MTGNRNMARL